MGFTQYFVDELLYDPEEIAAVKGRLELRRVDSDGNFDRTEDLPEDGAVFTSPLYECKAMDDDSGWDFAYVGAQRAYDVDGDQLGSIDYQVYDGTDYYYYSAGAWQVVVDLAADWTDEQDFFLYFGTYPGRTTRTIQLRCRIVPDSSGEYAPFPEGITFVWPVSFRYDSEEEFQRSVRRYCRDIEFISIARNKLSSLTATFVLNHPSSPVAGGSWAVYNLDTDPDFETNLFSSWDGTNVTMTAAQALGSAIETHFLGTADAFLSADEDFFVTETPSWVINSDSDSTVDRVFTQLGARHFVPKYGLEIIYDEHYPEAKRVPMRIFAQSNNPSEALNMAQEFATRIQIEPEITGIWINRPIRLVLHIDSVRPDSNIAEGLYISSVMIEGVIKQWELTRDRTELPVWKYLTVNVGGPKSVWSSVLINR